MKKYLLFIIALFAFYPLLAQTETKKLTLIK